MSRAPVNTVTPAPAGGALLAAGVEAGGPEHAPSAPRANADKTSG
jgi:hypothetical protein